MRISEMINDETHIKLLQLAIELEQPKKKEQPIKSQKKKSHKHFSKRELHNLMGVNRDRYHKVNGKVKRK